MENLLYNISQVLGITIVHSVWQGLLIYFGLRLIFLTLPLLPAVKKYNLSVLALTGMAAWFAVTFYTEIQIYDWSPAANASPFIAGLNLHNLPHAGLKETLYNSFKNYLPYISILYITGLAINLSKLAIAWNKIRIIKKSMILAENLQDRVNTFSKQLNISKQVKAGFSRMVDVPCVIGYVKPILLLPVTLTFRLSTQEIETILLHELSHIKNNDYVINLMQQLISVVLFFNPFARLINQMISAERENRCDDVVVQTTGNPLTYAYALLKLEEARQGELMLALAATQNKNQLLTRIERIMNTKEPIGNIRPILIAVLIFAGSLSSIAWLNPEIKNGKIILKNRSAKTAAINTGTPLAQPADQRQIAVKQNKKYVIYGDTARNKQLNDTTKKARIKIVVEDENGNKKEYNSVNDLPDSLRDSFYGQNKDEKFNMDFNADKYSRKMQKQIEAMQLQVLAMSRNTNDPAFKKQIEAMAKKANDPAFNKQIEAMAKKANDPAFSKQLDEMIRQAADMTKNFNSPEFKKQVEKLQQMGEYYNTPEGKKQLDDMQKQGADIEKRFNSPEFKKQMEDLQKNGEDIARYYDSPEWKKQVDDLAKQGAEFGTRYVNSPEWKKMQADIVKQAEDMAKQFGAYDERGEVISAKAQTEKPIKKEISETRKRALKAKAVKEAKEHKEKPEAKEQPEKPEAPESN